MFEPFIWKSTDYESFQKEHLELTEKISQYTSGDYYRIYSDKFINFLEKEINFNGDIYYPVVLTNSSEYNEESFIQSNCVKTYIGRPASIIISLRKDSKDSKERASIEFLPMKNIFDEIKFKRVQTLGRFNKQLDGYWNSPIKILDDRFLELKNFDLPELIVKFKGNEIKSKSEFNDSGFLKWVNESVRHINHNGLDLPLPHIQIYDLLDENLLLDF
jgi:hypothetical protein